MNTGKILVTLQTNDSNDGKVCGVVIPPARNDTFIFRWISYRVSDVRHELAERLYPRIRGSMVPEETFEVDTFAGDWTHQITLVLESK